MAKKATASKRRKSASKVSSGPGKTKKTSAPGRAKAATAKKSAKSVKRASAKSKTASARAAKKGGKGAAKRKKAESKKVGRKKLERKKKPVKAGAKRRRTKGRPGHEDLRLRLVEQREEIVGVYNSDLRRGQEAGDEGTEDIVDRANNAYNRELTFSLSDSERQKLLLIEEALVRLNEGRYGLCTHCGQKIAEGRLQVVPWARYCIDCQELQEKGLLEEA